VTRVRENLYRALLALRDTQSTRVLWVDALCINQSEVRERNHQVARMHEIYKSARKVLVWLGVQRDNSNVCFDCLNELRTRVIGADEFLPDQLGASTLQALFALLTRPYWRRVWIIQEVLCASEIELICGSKCLPWPKANPLEPLIKAKHKEVPKDASKQSLIREISGSPGAIILRERSYFKSQSWLMILSLCSRLNSQCWDIRDRVYGLIGLVGEYHSFKITPDYSKTVFQLYVDLLFGLLGSLDFRNGRNIDHVLSFTETMQKLLEDPFFNKSTGTFRQLGEIRRLVPYGPLCEPGAFRTFEICALFKIEHATPNDSEYKSMQLEYSYLDERTFERIQTIGTQYVWDDEVAESPGPKIWRPIALVQETARVSGPARKAKGFLAGPPNLQKWAFTSRDVQPGDIVCSIGSWGHLLVVIRLNKENPSFTLIARVHMKVWITNRRGLSVVPESDVLKEVRVLEGKTSPLILGGVFELQLSNQLTTFRMGPGWHLPLWSRRNDTISIDSITN
jgi:hypothetical protein